MEALEADLAAVQAAQEAGAALAVQEEPADRAARKKGVTHGEPPSYMNQKPLRRR